MKKISNVILGTVSKMDVPWAFSRLNDLISNKLGNLSFLSILCFVVPGLIALSAVGMLVRHICDGDTADGNAQQRVSGMRASIRRSRTYYFLCLWCVAVNVSVFTLLFECAKSSILRNTGHTVYYENYVLNYGLPMGTGHVTNECVAGWYRFDFVGTHAFSNEAKCLYGENRRYKFGWFDRYRTLRRVTQVNGKGDPLWFCDSGNDDGNTPVLEFAYASQADLTSAGAVPARLQVYYETMDQLNGLQAMYACNYWDRWGEPNAFVTLTKGFAGERYFVPGTSFDTRVGIPGRSNVSGYAVKWDEKGRQIERKCVAGRDVDGVVRKTYEYEVVPLGNGDEFTYVSSCKCFGIEDDEETLFFKRETTWVGLCCTERNFSDQGCEETRWSCRSRSLSTAARMERFAVDERFERIEDEKGNLQGCVIKYQYDERGNRIREDSFSDIDCSRPFLRKDGLAATERFSWTGDGFLASRETLDEQGSPMPTLEVKDKLVSRVEWIYGHGWLTTRGYDGTNVVKNITSYLPHAKKKPVASAVFSRTSEFDDGTHRIVEVVTLSADGAERDNEYGFSRSRSSYYKENREEDLYPNGRMASLEYFSANGTLCTNAVSEYYTYRRGLLMRVDYKSGCVKDGSVVPSQQDFYRMSSGGYMPATAMMEYDEQGRVVCEWRLDLNESTNALPRDMTYCIEYEYHEANDSPSRVISTSMEAVRTNDLQSADWGAN